MSHDLNLSPSNRSLLLRCPIAYESGLIRVNYKNPLTEQKENVGALVLVNGFRPKGAVREHRYNPPVYESNVERDHNPRSMIRINRTPKLVELLPAAVPIEDSPRASRSRAIGPLSPRLGIEAPRQSPVRPSNSEDKSQSGSSHLQMVTTKKGTNAKERRSRKTSSAISPVNNLQVALIPEKRGRRKAASTENTYQIPQKRGRKAKTSTENTLPVALIPDNLERQPTSSMLQATPRRRGRRPRSSTENTLQVALIPQYLGREPTKSTETIHLQENPRRRGQKPRTSAENTLQVALIPENRGSQFKAYAENNFQVALILEDLRRQRTTSAENTLLREAPRRGRPRKNKNVENIKVDTLPKRRGRRPKKDYELDSDYEDEILPKKNGRKTKKECALDSDYQEKVVPKKRGRRPKNECALVNYSQADVSPPKRSRRSAKSESDYIPEVNTLPKKRGRKPKIREPDSDLQIAIIPKKRGRRPKVKPPVTDPEVTVPKRRGRKPKARVIEPVVALLNDLQLAVIPKKRGRKPKVRAVSPTVAIYVAPEGQSAFQSEAGPTEERLATEDLPADEEPMLVTEGNPPDEEPMLAIEYSPPDEEPLLAIEDSPPDEEPQLAIEDCPPDEEPQLAIEDCPPDEEPQLVIEDCPPDEEPMLAIEDCPPDGEPQLAIEDCPPDEESMLAIEDCPPDEEPQLAIEDCPPDEEPMLAVEDCPRDETAPDVDEPPLAIENSSHDPRVTFHPLLEHASRLICDPEMQIPLKLDIERPLSKPMLAITDGQVDKLSIAEKIKLHPRIRRSSLPCLKQDDDDEDEINKKLRKKRKYVKKTTKTKKEAAKEIVHVQPHYNVQNILPRMKEKRKIEEPPIRLSDDSLDSFPEYVPKRRKKKPSTSGTPINYSFTTQKSGSAMKRKNMHPQKAEQNNKLILKEFFHMEVPLIPNRNYSVFSNTKPTNDKIDSLEIARFYKQRLKSVDFDVTAKTDKITSEEKAPIKHVVEPEYHVVQQVQMNTVQRHNIIRTMTPSLDHSYTQPQVVLRKSDRCDPNLNILLRAADECEKQELNKTSQLVPYDDSFTSHVQIVETDLQNLDIQQDVSIGDECNMSKDVFIPGETEAESNVIQAASNGGTEDKRSKNSKDVFLPVEEANEFNNNQGMVVLASGIAALESLELTKKVEICQPEQKSQVKEVLNPTIAEIKPLIDPNEEDPLVTALKNLEHEMASRPSTPTVSLKKQTRCSDKKIPKGLENHGINMERVGRTKLDDPEQKQKPKHLHSPQKRHPLNDKSTQKHSKRSHHVSIKKLPKDHVLEPSHNIVSAVPRKPERLSSENCHATTKTDNLLTPTETNKLDLENRKCNGHNIKAEHAKPERHRNQSENEKSTKKTVQVPKKRSFDGTDSISACEKNKKFRYDKLFPPPPLDKKTTGLIVKFVNLFSNDTYREKKKVKKSPTTPLRKVVRSIYAPPESAVVGCIRKIRR